jgi:hypothetical protein
MIRTTEASRSAVVAVTTFVCNLMLCSLAGYALARPLIAITSTNQMTLPLGLATFQSAHSTDWTLLMDRLDAADGRQRDEPGPDAADLLRGPAVLHQVGRRDRSRGHVMGVVCD